MSAVSNIRSLVTLLELNATREGVLLRRHLRLKHIQARLLHRAQTRRQTQLADEQQRRRLLQGAWHSVLARSFDTAALNELARDEAWHASTTRAAADSERRYSLRLQACADYCRQIESRLRASRKRRVALDTMKCRLEAHEADRRERIDDEAAMDIVTSRHGGRR